ncbi:BrnT family toxin [Skermanella rosea]|uniref:BrnT family toxin n=1 Tax=Skermanella rosea TaxID=1817965 RepID=UPI001933AC0D|nr:BrnT family toxin [Skermanella rosea]UEM04157.1 BrnT family toxin [Skermanella rosea]
MDLEFEWSEAKRQATLEARGVDFLRMRELFDGRPVVVYLSARGAEERWVSVCRIEDKFFAVVWTIREERIRIISARRARYGEERRYRAVYRIGN